MTGRVSSDINGREVFNPPLEESSSSGNVGRRGGQNKNTVKRISIIITVIVAIFFAITAASIGFQYMNYAYSKLFLNMSLAKRAAIFSGVAVGLGVGTPGTIIAVALAFFSIVKCVRDKYSCLLREDEILDA